MIIIELLHMQTVDMKIPFTIQVMYVDCE